MSSAGVPSVSSASVAGAFFDARALRFRTIFPQPSSCKSRRISGHVMLFSMYICGSGGAFAFGAAAATGTAAGPSATALAAAGAGAGAGASGTLSIF